MGKGPQFDLVLLGYRNDLARERVLEFLRGLPSPPPGADRDAALPCRLFVGLDYESGLRLAAQLRECGAQVRLVASAQELTPPQAATLRTVAPDAHRSRSVRPLLLLVAVAAAVYAYRRPLDGPLPPPLPADTCDSGASSGSDRGVVDTLTAHRLNDEAVALNQAGEYAAAAERLRAAIEREPNQPVLQRNLRAVLYNWGVVELNSNRPDVAIDVFEQGLAIEEDAALLTGLGVAHVRNGEWPAAQRALERALELGADDANTFMALGTVYRQQGNQEGAVEMLQRARAAGAAGKGFTAALQQLERELDAEWDFAKLTGPHFQLAFAQEENHVAARVVLAGLEQAYFSVGSKFEAYPPGRTPVVLYAREAFSDITQTPSWTGGVYDGRIKLPVGGLVERSAVLDRTLRHEYAHVVIGHLSRGRTPVWLNEGLAIWAEEVEDRERESWARRTIAGRRLLPLRELQAPFKDLSEDQVPVAYAQSYLAVRALLDDFGARRLRELLTALGEGRALDTAFEEVFAIQDARFEADFLRRLTGG